MMKKNWQLLPQNESLAQSLAYELDLHPAIAQVLINRNIITIDEIKSFLNPKLGNLHDPFLFCDMSKCVLRILQAAKSNEKVFLYGDYDVDGVTGSALLSDLFSKIGIEHECYIPHRILEGYGLSNEGIEQCYSLGCSLLITVDCGIRGHHEIEYAHKLGIEVIITDHHEPDTVLPACFGIINPKVIACGYPFKDLAGVSVAFKLAHGLIKEGRNNHCNWAYDIDLKEYLDLVVLGTIADIVPLYGENRILAKNGFLKLSETKRPGLEALKRKVGIADTVTTFDVAFKLAPRLNAAGRVGDAKESLNIIQTTDFSEAEFLANNLDLSNKERQQLEEKTYKEALLLLENQFELDDVLVLVLAKEGWPVGVLGIVASRLVRQFHRPVFVLSIKKAVAKGSGRSIEGFDLSVVLPQCEDMLENYGGHAYAAGVTTDENNIDAFREKINAIAFSLLSQEQLVKKILIDSVLKKTDITESLISQIEKLHPFGQDNPEPLFISNNVYCDSFPMILKEKHVKFTVYNENTSFDVIGFNMADRAHEFGKGNYMNIIYQLSFNEFRGRKSMQLRLKDFEVVN
ncbi:single-stranded-DNA-specific exonuclease RecJ [Chlamydiota bacterium]